MKSYRIADLFCGAGGTSVGAAQAVEERGYKCELTAINHDETAIHTHLTNHPGARHLLTSLDNINPRELYQPGELQLLWASPECTHHSTARGGKPIQDQSRATAMCVIRWAEALMPPVVLVENVPEFLTWGPLDRHGRPVKHRKGEIFAAWRAMLVAIGYQVDHRILCAADYGDPTTRRRLFIQAVRGRRRIRWPEPSHGQVKDGGQGQAELFLQRRLPWRDAATHVIDWTLEGQLLTERKKPLADKTMRRIIVGFFKQLEKKGFGPFVVPNFGERETQDPRSHDLDEPLPAVTSHGAGGLVEPEAFIIGTGGPTGAAKPQSVDLPLGAVLCQDRRGVVTAEAFVLPKEGIGGGNAARPVSEPVPTVLTDGIGHLVEPEAFVISAGGPTCPARGVSEPLGTVLTRDHRAVVEPMIIPQNSSNDARPCTKPAPTVTTTSRGMGLSVPILVRFQGSHAGRADCQHRTQGISEPLGTVTTENRFGLAEPLMVGLRGSTAAHLDSSGKSTAEPLGTVTANGNHTALVTPLVVQMKGTHAGAIDSTAVGADQPLGTLTTQNTFGLAEPLVIAIDHQGGNGDQHRGVDKPLSTVSTKARHAIAEPSLEAMLIQTNHGNGHCGDNGDARRCKDIGDPLPTVTGNRGEWSLVEPAVLPQQSDGALRPVSQPLPTVAGAGAIALVQAYLVKFYGTGVDASIDEPLDSVTVKDRFGLVLPVLEFSDGQRLLVNFRFRMLQPHELAAAQGFPKGYCFKGTKTQQVKQVGNAVPCNLAKALVKAVLQ